MTEQETLELDPERAAQRKKRAARRLHAVEIPLYRLIGMTFMVLLVRLHPGESPLWTWLFPAVSIGYALLSWAILWRWDRLGIVFLYLDVIVYCLTIYLTGVEQSWYIFLLIVREADQIPAGPRRTLAFAHFNLACYVLMLGVAVLAGHTIEGAPAIQKALIIYLSGLYLSLSALTAEGLRQRAARALRASRGLILELEKRTQELEEANQAKTRFLANTSHELRTPMNGVLGMLDLTMDTELTEQQRSYLRDARDSASSLLRVLNDILDVSKLESGRFTIHPTPFELKDFLTELQSFFVARARSQGVELQLEMTPGLPGRISADRDRLRQILLNLLDNAFKFTEQGAIVLTARADPLEARKVKLTVSVSDTGQGISPEKLDQMFEPFVQGDDSMTRQQGGTGLGLAICRELAQLMQGSLTAVSQLEKGSVFTLELPVEVLASAAPAVAINPDQPGFRPLKILVAEDNPVNQRVCLRMLERFGHRALLASDGNQALAMAEQDTFDLILMDIQMPGLDGLEVTRKLRDEGNAVPIVALTAHATVGYREFCLSQGMDGYLDKPIRMEDLKRVLEQYSRA